LRTSKMVKRFLGVLEAAPDRREGVGELAHDLLLGRRHLDVLQYVARNTIRHSYPPRVGPSASIL
jgi:hypothetical protein